MLKTAGSLQGASRWAIGKKGLGSLAVFSSASSSFFTLAGSAAPPTPFPARASPRRSLLSLPQSARQTGRSLPVRAVSAAFSTVKRSALCPVMASLSTPLTVTALLSPPPRPSVLLPVRSSARAFASGIGVGPPFGGAAPSGGGFFRSRAWRPQTRPAAAAEDAADHDSNARIVEADNPVYAKTFPFNLIYMHHSTWVIPLDPRSPGKHSGAMYLTLLGLCLTVWWAWQLAQMPPGVRAPVTPEEMAQLVSTERDARGNIESLVHGLSQADVNYVARKMDWMFDNFTVNCSSVVHRPWTIFTSALSHQGLDHLAGNFLSLFIFAPKVYNFLGPRYFTGLYLAGAAGCSLMHATLNAASGRTDPPLRYAELIALSDQVSDERATEIVKSRDTPCLGASGSCIAASAILFPRDRVFMRQTFVPIPIAAAIYFFVDLVSVYASPDSDVGHAGHVGGFLAGLGYLAYLWNFRRIGGLTARERFKSPLPFFAMLKKRANPIGFVTSASK